MAEKINGRPRNDGSPAGKYSTTDLFKLLSERLTEYHRHGSFSVPDFADALGYTKMHMYRTIESNRLSRKMFAKLVEETGLTKEELLPYAPADIRILLTN